jgi:hypothetical protein
MHRAHSHAYPLDTRARCAHLRARPLDSAANLTRSHPRRSKSGTSLVDPRASWRDSSSCPSFCFVHLDDSGSSTVRSRASVPSAEKCRPLPSASWGALILPDQQVQAPSGARGEADRRESGGRRHGCPAHDPSAAARPDRQIARKTLSLLLFMSRQPTISTTLPDGSRIVLGSTSNDSPLSTNECTMPRVGRRAPVSSRSSSDETSTRRWSPRHTTSPGPPGRTRFAGWAAAPPQGLTDCSQKTTSWSRLATKDTPPS